MKKMLIVLLAGVLSIGTVACSSTGVSQEEYSKVVAERDVLKEQLANLTGQPNIKSPKDNLPTPEKAGNFEDGQYEIQTYRYDNDYWHYSFVAVKNTSDSTCDMSVDVNYFDADKRLIGAKNSTDDAIPSNGESLFMFIDEENFDSFEPQVSASESKYYQAVTQNISYDVNTTDKKAVITATNNGDINAEFLKCYALFFNGDNVVGYGDTYCIDDDSELKAGKTKSVEIECYEPFDDVKIYFSGRASK